MRKEGNPNSETQSPIDDSAATPKRQGGRPLVPPELNLWGSLCALVDIFEKGWPLIGWGLERIRNAPKPPSLGAFRKSLEPVRDWGRSYVLNLLLSDSVEETTLGNLRQVRGDLGQAVAAARLVQVALERQTRLCQEAEAALKEAGPDQKEIVQAAKAKHDAELNKLQETLRKGNEKRDKLSKKLLAREVFFAQSEALDFLRSKRYKLTPRNLSAALAGSPYIRWRTSIVRCRRIGCGMAESTNYLVFLAVSQILQGKLPKTAREAVQFFQAEIPKLPKKPRHAKDFLTQNWAHFKKTIEDEWESCSHRRRLRYDLTAAFMKNVTRPTTALDRVLAAQEKLET